ncbi:hypothetical protein BJ944DRAFT_198826 [Cunninghamella echinulata]|nr:hypothetical protein BJ944DRAFT_198826 [Cunninghamella echinulata]
MYKLVSALLLLTFTCQQVFGHYHLTYPPSRGFDETNEVVAPCGGFNTPQSNRTSFPLKNGFLQIDSEHTKYNYKIYLIVKPSPAQSDFNGDANTLVAESSVNYPMQSCLPVDVSKVSGAIDGASATFQISYNAGDGILYQCTDVILQNQPTNFNTSACINADGSKPSLGGNGNNNGTSSNSPSAANSLQFGMISTILVLITSMIIM